MEGEGAVRGRFAEEAEGFHDVVGVEHARAREREAGDGERGGETGARLWSRPVKATVASPVSTVTANPSPPTWAAPSAASDVDPPPRPVSVE